MSRVRKLLTVGVVLAGGIGLAWPFRKTVSPEPGAAQPVSALDSLVIPSQPVRPPARHVAAKMASTGEPKLPPGSASFDLANHPAIANHPPSASVQPTTPHRRSAQDLRAPTNRKQSASRPAYAIADAPGEADKPQEIVHIVRNTDTLEKLAERYLGEAGRALEIFDLNRDQLTNPHLLPIGAKLKIPVMPGRALD